jgi:hypothetical protein
MAAAATGIDTKCKAIENKLPDSCCHWYWHKMQCNLEQITWQLLPPVLTQKAQQLKKLPGNCCHRY